VDHPSAGKVSLPDPPLRFDDNLFAGARERHLPPPRLGEHNESIRAWLAE
jgi:crotonobetainyl-CoA:carnitine CoA-transferase CaiB-like acyl-CoA transferase